MVDLRLYERLMPCPFEGRACLFLFEAVRDYLLTLKNAIMLSSSLRGTRLRNGDRHRSRTD